MDFNHPPELPKEPYPFTDIRGHLIVRKPKFKREQRYAKGKGVRKQSHLHASEPPNRTKTPEVKVCGMPSCVLKQKQATANAPPKTKLKGVKESNVLANTGVFSNPYCAKNSSHIVHTESKDQLERDVKEIWRDYDQEFAVIVSDIEDDIKTKKINAKEAAESFKSVLTKFLES